MPGPQKRSVSIAGHRTSISLEPVFWDLLSEAATDQETSVAGLVTEIDASRETNLSSAIRTWLVTWLRDRQPAPTRGPGAPDP
ncbi:MAG: ribbon-helix-helix domain-containing protein [Alphaproteobacteria bacterium]